MYFVTQGQLKRWKASRLQYRWDELKPEQLESGTAAGTQPIILNKEMRDQLGLPAQRHKRPTLPENMTCLVDKLACSRTVGLSPELQLNEVV